MLGFFKEISNYFSTSGFMPHGHCFLWKSNLLIFHIFSDSLLGLAYFCFPIALIFTVRKRGDLPYNWLFWLLFAVFITCGTIHFTTIYTLWVPSYWFLGIVKFFTAIASACMVVSFYWIIPQIFKIPIFRCSRGRFH